MQWSLAVEKTMFSLLGQFFEAPLRLDKFMRKDRRETPGGGR